MTKKFKNQKERDNILFFELSGGFATRYITLEAIESKDCKNLDDFIKRIKNNTLHFKIDRGKEHGDMAIGSWVTFFFSENFVKLLKKNKIKLSAYKIKFERNLRKLNYYYYYIEPLSKQVDVINKKGTVKWFKDSEGKKAIMARKGLYLNLKKWDGSKFFSIKKSRIYIVTEEFKKTIEKANLKNIKFENVIDYSFGSIK